MRSSDPDRTPFAPPQELCSRCGCAANRYDARGAAVCGWCAYFDGDTPDAPERNDARVRRAAPDLMAALTEIAVGDPHTCGNADLTRAQSFQRIARRATAAAE